MLLSSLAFSLLAVKRLVMALGVTAAGWRSVLETQRAADGRCQDHAQDDAADDDHDLLLQGDRGDGPMRGQNSSHVTSLNSCVTEGLQV